MMILIHYLHGYHIMIYYNIFEVFPEFGGRHKLHLL